MTTMPARVDLPTYRVAGAGEPLVLIMGLAGPKEAWWPQVQAFRRAYRVITFDNRGVDRARGLGPEPLTIREMAGDVGRLLDHLGIARAHILGYSLGGLVAQEFVLGHPDRVDKLILASTFAPSAGSAALSGGVHDALAAEFTAASPDARRSMAAIMGLSFNRPAYRAVLSLLAGIAGRRMAGPGLAAQFGAGRTADTLDRLGSIRAPTLVITGAADRLIDPQNSRVLASRIPGASLVQIPGAGHAFAIERAGAFNQEVLAFLGA